MTQDLPAILLLGHPLLRRVCEPVQRFNADDLLKDAQNLHEVLLRFRDEHGFGRGIAAPQIGIIKRILALNLKGRPTTMINPEITWSSDDEFILWDDCMSFPELLVRVSRNSSISVKFFDESGQSNCWNDLDPSTSELLQHEIDHLDGILALDRAIDKSSISYRSNVLSGKVGLNV